MILNDIRKISEFSNICFTFIKRYVNMTAHCLARKDLFKLDCRECSYFPFDCIVLSLM